ncbi:MAG: Wzz/FepE/Etk N-terminal domain-containing protein [Mangrovibacterium sp.]
MNQENKNTNSVEADEIDLIELVHYLWNRRKFIIKMTIGFMLLGVLFALFSSKEYTASTKLLPQSSNAKAGGNMSALAAMAGISMGTGSSTELTPVIYPQIVKSVPFQLELINASYHCPGVDEPISLYTYYTEYNKPSVLSLVKRYTIGLPGLILGAFRGEDNAVEVTKEAPYVSLQEEEEAVIQTVSNQISIEINDKEGYVTVGTVASDPVMAAELARKVQDLLQEYITKYKIAQASEQLSFVESRLKEKEAEFVKVQNELAVYRDRNHNVSSALALTEIERLQTKYNLSFSIYSELAKQYETALIKVKEETPVFAVIEPVQLPNKPSAPNKPLIVIIWAFLGGFLSVGIVFGKKFVASVKDDWNKYEN